MDRSRFVITDYQWERMDPYCLGASETQGGRGVTLGCFLRRFFG